MIEFLLIVAFSFLAGYFAALEKNTPSCWSYREEWKEYNDHKK